MKSRCPSAALLAAVLCQGAWAQTAPSFEVGYRAWDVVTELARRNNTPDLGGECGKTFRPFVIPGLKRQTKQEEDIASAACVQAARSACANGKLQRTAEIARKCEEFR